MSTGKELLVPTKTLLGPSVESYHKRFLNQILTSTKELLVTQQIITTFAISLFGLFLTYLLGITPEPLASQTVPKQILLVLCTYALVFLVIIIVNAIRAPFIIDKAQNELIAKLQQEVINAESRLKESHRQLEAITLELEERNTTPNHQLRANLVYSRIRLTSTSTDRYVGEDEEGTVTWLVEFKNEANASFRASDAIVRATIFFEDFNGFRVREVPDGAWLSERSRSTKFRLNDTKELVIAIKTEEGVKTLGTSKASLFRRGIKFIHYDLPEGEYQVVVQLVTAKPSILLGEYRFRLATVPQFELSTM